MKKLLLLCTFLLLILSVSCTKNTQLSEFVVGNWKSQTLTLGNSPFGYFSVDIKANDKYVLSFTVPTMDTTLVCPETGYSVDNTKSQVTIDQPTFPGNTPSTGTVTFDVAWKEKTNNYMTWTPVDTTGNGTPTLDWTRQ